MMMRDGGLGATGVVLCAALTSSVGAAEEQVPSGIRGMLLRSQLAGVFSKADVNHDGHLTKEEAQTGMPRVYAHFDEIDKDQKGFVTLEQIRAYLDASAAKSKSPKSPDAPASAPAEKQSP